MSKFKEQLIRLGSTNPELRQHLRPILASLSSRTARQDSFDLPIDPRGATVYFDLVFEDYNLEEDLADPNKDVNLPGGPWTMEDYNRGDITDVVLKLEFEALKEAKSVLGISRIGNEGHDSFGNLSCKFGISSLQELKDLYKKIRQLHGGGDDIIYFDHYFNIGHFQFYPQSVGTTSPIEFQDWDEYIDFHS